MSSKKFSGFSLSKKPQTAFEKAQAEKAEKARMEKEALDSVMADFLEEHGDAPVTDQSSPPPQNVTVPQGNRRHYAAKERSMKSGPGTLEPLAPIDAFPRPGPGGFGNQPWAGRVGPQIQARPSFVVKAEPEEDPFRMVIAKASNLPPDMDQQSVKKLFEPFDTLKVVKVDVIPPKGPSEGRPSIAMKVTFEKSANARDLDDAMNKLSDKKYLGKGYYLHLDRYLGPQTKEQPQKLPFGARWVTREIDISSRPHNQFAPPPDLGGPGSRNQAQEEERRLVVTVVRPPDLPTLRLIHMVVEKVIRGGMEFECALMNDARVVNDERYAFLYDSTHPLARYYRWTLYRLVCGEPDGPVEIFEGCGEWEGPADRLPFEFAYQPDDFDPDDEDPHEEPDENIGKRHVHPDDAYPGYIATDSGPLNPRARLFLMWLFHNLPDDDELAAFQVAPFSTFAHDHAANGMDEIITLLVTNVFRPFCWQESKDPEGSEGEIQNRRVRKTATMNALRIISDVASTANQAGGKCYKYREGLGEQLVERKVFEFLDQLGRRASTGKVSLIAWQNDVNYLLDVWHEDRLFNAIDHFIEVFNAQEKEEEQKRAREKAARERERAKKSVKVGQPREDENPGDGDQMDVDEDESKRESTVVADANIPVQSEANSTNVNDDQLQNTGSHSPSTDQNARKQEDASSSTEHDSKDVQGEPFAARARRVRPKAEDLFGSDEE